jgi:hypothetical protein
MLNLQPIYDYFDYEEGYMPNYLGEPNEAQNLVDYLIKRGYTYKQKEDKAIFKKARQTIVGVGETESEAITRAFLNYLKSFEE